MWILQQAARVRARTPVSGGRRRRRLGREGLGSTASAADTSRLPLAYPKPAPSLTLA